MCNLSLTSLSLNKISECLSYFNNCLELVRGQFDIPDKIQMLKELVYIFFRIDSLQNYYEKNLHLQQNQNPTTETINRDVPEDDESMINRMASKTLFALHRTLRENNIEFWIKCLNEEAKKLRSIKDINGYVFVLINSFAANFYQTGKITETVKTNFSKILKIYAEQYNKDLKLKEKNLTVIFTDFKNRIDTAMEIYKKLLDTESELNNIIHNLHPDNINESLINNNTKTIKEINEKLNLNPVVNTAIANKILIKIFFKHALKMLAKNQETPEIYNSEKICPSLSSDMRNQLELALKLLENDEFDFSTINIFNINSEITKSLKLLFENLIAIRNKCLLYKYFKLYMCKTFDVDDILVKRHKKIQIFMENRVDVICSGGAITKVHFSSSGFSKYYYKVNPENKTLIIYKNQTAYEEKEEKPYKVIPFTEIKEVVYGLTSENLKKRYKNISEKNLKSPWLFLSLMLNKRSIDLYFDTEESLVNWFYGLNYFIKGYKIPTKIISISKFIITKLKLKLITNLKEIAERDEKNPNKSLLILTQLNNYVNTNQMGFDSLTFVQVLLLFRKIKDKQNSNQSVIYK